MNDILHYLKNFPYSQNLAKAKELYNEFYYKNLLVSQKIAEFGINQANKYGDYQEALGFKIKFLSVILNKGKFEKAKEVLKEAFIVARKFKDFNNLSRLYNISGAMHNRLGNYVKSYLHYQKSLRFIKKSNFSQFTYVMNSNLGILFNDIGFYSLSIDLLNKSLEKLKKYDDKHYLSANFCILGNSYLNLKDYERAEYYFRKSIQLKKENESENLLSSCYTNLARIYKLRNNLSKAEFYIEKSFERIDFENLFFGDYSILLEAAYIKLEAKNFSDYMELENLLKRIVDTALPVFKTEINILKSTYYIKIKELTKAKKLLDRVLKVSIEKKLYVKSLKALEKLIKIYEEENDFKKAFLYSNQKVEINKMISHQERRMQLHQMKSLLKEEDKKSQYYSKKADILNNQMKKIVKKPFIGVSLKIRKVYEKAEKAAEFSNSNVLITGESGTGKEVLARIIHYKSKRKNNIFCPINCSAVPENLFESEFFGHVKGAFTGASHNKIGIFEKADKGTVFLDEIGDMPFYMQAKLLRTLEEKRIKKIGSNKITNCDFRIISATNKNLEKAINSNDFRMDLFFRLNTIIIEIPPLKERPEDIPVLIDYFFRKISKEMNKSDLKFPEELVKKLRGYSFPGNVRELKNIVEQYIIHDSLKDNYSPKFMNKQNFVETHFEKYDNLNLKKIEINAIKKALQITNNNKTAAGKLLGISRNTINRKIKMLKN